MHLVTNNTHNRAEIRAALDALVYRLSAAVGMCSVTHTESTLADADNLDAARYALELFLEDTVAQADKIRQMV